MVMNIHGCLSIWVLGKTIIFMNYHLMKYKMGILITTRKRMNEFEYEKCFSVNLYVEGGNNYNDMSISKIKNSFIIKLY